MPRRGRSQDPGGEQPVLRSVGGQVQRRLIPVQQAAGKVEVLAFERNKRNKRNKRSEGRTPLKQEFLALDIVRLPIGVSGSG